MQNQIQDIATATATTAAQNFLNTIPDRISQALSPAVLNSLGEDLQNELQSLIQSRLLWTQQAVQLELAEQQRLKELELTRPEMTQPVPFAQQLNSGCGSAAKRHTLRKVAEPQKTPVPTPEPDAGVIEKESAAVVLALAVAVEHPQNGAKPSARLQDSQLTLPGLSEPESLKVPRRRSTLEPSREEILSQFNLNLEDFQPRDSDATPRRRRRRSAAIT